MYRDDVLVSAHDEAPEQPFSVVDIIQSPVFTGYQGWDTYYYQYDSVDENETRTRRKLPHALSNDTA